MIKPRRFAVEKELTTAFLRQHRTNSLSYSYLQEGVDCFIEHECYCIAYSPIDAGAVRPLCLAEPICPPGKIKQLIGRFLNLHKDKIFLHALASQVSMHIAGVQNDARDIEAN
jgi:hypothetical protein